MNKTSSLKLNKDFKRLYYRGKSVACGYVVVYAGKNRLGENRMGITCGKTIGKAVVRNRVKRLIREGYRLNEDKLNSGYDIVIVARTRAVGKKMDVIRRDIRYAFSKLELLKEENPK